MTKLPLTSFIRLTNLVEYHNYSTDGLPIPNAVDVPPGEYAELEDMFLDTGFKAKYNPPTGGFWGWGSSGDAENNDFYWKAISIVFDNLFNYTTNGNYNFDKKRYKHDILPGMFMMLNTDGRKIFANREGYGCILNNEGEGPTVFQVSHKSLWHNPETHENYPEVCILDMIAKPPELRGNKSSISDWKAVGLVIKYLWPEATLITGEIISPECFGHEISYPSANLSIPQSVSKDRYLKGMDDELEAAKKRRAAGPDSWDKAYYDARPGLWDSKPLFLNPHVDVSVDDVLRGNTVSMPRDIKTDLYNSWKKGSKKPSDIYNTIEKLKL